MTQQIPALEADGATGSIWDRRPRAARAAFPSLESAVGLRSSLPSSGQTLLCPGISCFSLVVVFFKGCHFISLAQNIGSEHWLAQRSCSRTSSSLVRLVGWPGGQLRGLRTCRMAVAPFPGPSLHSRPTRSLQRWWEQKRPLKGHLHKWALRLQRLRTLLFK